MIRVPSSRLASSVLLVATLAVGMAGCADPSAPDAGPLSLAKGGGKPPGTTTVTATDPPYGYEGDQNKTVKITGSGFEPGARAEWQRGGVADRKIQVLETNYISSTQLEATISIDTDAELGFYDVAVNYTGRKGGVGTELFEVTTAFPIAGAARAFDVNDAGQIAGVDNAGQPFVFSQGPGGGLEVIGPAGFMGMAISQDGLTVAGSHNLSHDGDLAVVWSKGDGGWTQASLPQDPAAAGSGADAIGSDPTTGAAHYVAGWEYLAGGRGKAKYAYLAPRVWVNNGSSGGWTRIALPTGPGGPAGRAGDVATNGVVVGATNGRATVWDPGPGGYSASVLGASGSRLEGVNDAGTLVVGTDGTTAVYWERPSTTTSWVGPIAFPTNCGVIHAVDNSGHAVGLCAKTESVNAGAVVLPPYSLSSIVFLNGLGNKAEGPNPLSLSPNGDWIVGVTGGTGSGTPGGALQAVYWGRF